MSLPIGLSVIPYAGVSGGLLWTLVSVGSRHGCQVGPGGRKPDTGCSKVCMLMTWGSFQFWGSGWGLCGAHGFCCQALLPSLLCLWLAQEQASGCLLAFLSLWESHI